MAALQPTTGQRRKQGNSPRIVRTNEETKAAPVDVIAPKAEVLKIITVGDVYWDTVIVPWQNEGTNQEYREFENTCYRIDRRAGTWLLGRFIKLVSQQIGPQVAVVEPSINDPELAPHSSGRAVTIVKLFPKRADDPKKKVYRISESYGWIAEKERAREAYPPMSTDNLVRYEKAFGRLHESIYSAAKDTTIPRIVVINDDNHVFRYLKEGAKVVDEITKYPCCIIVLAINSPLMGNRLEDNDKNPIWNIIEGNDDLCERTVVVVSVAALRAHGLNIREIGPIETVGYDLVRQIQPGTILHKLMKCAHVLVRDTDGVFYFDKNEPKRFERFFLQFDGGPRYNFKYFGVMSGYEKILLASIVKELAKGVGEFVDRQQQTKEPKEETVQVPINSAIRKGIQRGIRSGIRRWWKHFDNGFPSGDQGFPYNYLLDENLHPFDHLFQEDQSVECPKLARVEFPFILNELGNWTRVASFREKSGKVTSQEYDEFLSNVVKKGLRESLDEVASNLAQGDILCPYAKFGQLEVIDRDEIAGFVAIYTIIQKYLNDPAWNTPLSLAVFGPPGSGKSFTVKEIFKAVRASSASAEKGVDALVYNLAEFTKPANLTIAFHQAQDRALSQEVPLIFFDEFDSNLESQPYGWLKYFLAPMQDGKFKGADSEGSYRVGKAIFVFAGGTAEEFNEFRKASVSEDQIVKNSKIKDFISRLRGHLNIKGIGKSKSDNVISDVLALRRAIALRSILDRKANRIFHESKFARIDERLINAFLWVGGYEHGVRSMEAIVEMSVPEKGHLRVGSLPAPDQLSMHVNVEEFLNLTKKELPQRANQITQS
jgi:hypothetical protein